MIVCDRCMNRRVDEDGDLCDHCKEILRERTVLDYLKDYLISMEEDYTVDVAPSYIKGLKAHIMRMETQEEILKQRGQGFI